MHSSTPLLNLAHGRRCHRSRATKMQAVLCVVLIIYREHEPLKGRTDEETALLFLRWIINGHILRFVILCVAELTGQPLRRVLGWRTLPEARSQVSFHQFLPYHMSQYGALSNLTDFLELRLFMSTQGSHCFTSSG